MNTLFKSTLLGLGLALLSSGAAFAKEPARNASVSASASAPVILTASASSSIPRPILIDINTANKSELSALPKVGFARSDAIIKGRPYKRKDELLDRKILTADVYNEIKDRIIAKQSAAEKK
jgi:DNA uptake protein ComE-like DNA-binding protein